MNSFVFVYFTNIHSCGFLVDIIGGGILVEDMVQVKIIFS